MVLYVPSTSMSAQTQLIPTHPSLLVLVLLLTLQDCPVRAISRCSDEGVAFLQRPALPSALPHVAASCVCRIALYVPSAGALTRGGFFYQRPGTDTYDTIISAQHILKSVADSHASQLTQLQLQLDASKQLMQSQPLSSSSKTSAAAAAAGGAVVAAGEGKKGKQGSAAAAAAAAQDVAGSLMQLVVAGLSTDEDVSGGN
jgi:hypothetical protein